MNDIIARGMASRAISQTIDIANNKTINHFSFNSGAVKFLYGTTTVSLDEATNKITINRANAGQVQAGIALNVENGSSYLITVSDIGSTFTVTGFSIRTGVNSGSYGSNKYNIVSNNDGTYSYNFTGESGLFFGFNGSLLNTSSTIKVTLQKVGEKTTVVNPSLYDYEITSMGIFDGDNITLKSKREYRLKNAVATITFSIGTIAENYSSIVTFLSASTIAVTISNTSGYPLKFMGEDCESGDFYPVQNKTYTIAFFFNGVYIVGSVIGVIL